MILDKPCMKRLNPEFVSVDDLYKFIADNHVMPNTPIWIDFGDGNGTFLRKDAGKNWKTNEGLTFDNGVLRLNLSPNCLNWVKIDALHPVKLTNNKTEY